MDNTRTRKFNGMIYKFAGFARTKASIEQFAKEVRQKGRLARVTKEKVFYVVWYRKK
ncbi:MAG: hypothetical protein M0R51_09395 [Clostridia bacterium]|jgi:hypothetical protein|nr:hypothetical protein [Clostridia bacterium]